MKRILALILSVLMLSTLHAGAEIDIVCSLFPQYDFARIIAGAHASVTQLLPNGVDSHGYEPSMRDMLNTDGADMFIYTDDMLEGWVETFLGGLSNVKSVRCADGIDLEGLNQAWQEACHEAHEHDHSDIAHSHGYDAHIWLDPNLAAIMCENIAKALCEIDPENENTYLENARAYTMELVQLDAEFHTLFHDHPDAVLYFGGKFAYSHFLRHYNVNYVTAYATCSDEGEPSARTIMNMVDRMIENDVKVIFTDEMSSGQVAKALAEQTGAEVCVLHTCHNLSKEDSEKGKTYLDLMRENLESIRKAIS